VGHLEKAEKGDQNSLLQGIYYKREERRKREGKELENRALKIATVLE
jgi:hypothetical protein